MLDDEQRLIQARVSLTQKIDRGSVVLSSQLAGAFLNVPRHPFVPVFYRREGERFIPWRSTDGDAEAWLDAVYTDDSLITEVDGVHAEQADPGGVTGVPTSSSTAPSLMADMLDALDVNEGDEVYEAGAGSGYNAAMLCHLAGDKHVTTVDRSDTLTALARERLNGIGFDPLVIPRRGCPGCTARRDLRPHHRHGLGAAGPAPVAGAMPYRRHPGRPPQRHAHAAE